MAANGNHQHSLGPPDGDYHPIGNPPPYETGRAQYGGSSSGGIQKAANGLEDIYIAVMGVTGSGKSSFIEECTGKEVGVGHKLQSCTVDVEEFDFVFKDRFNVHLIDTPGFDDTNRKDTEVLRDIACWMSSSYDQSVRITGIVYLHRITDTRMQGSARRNLFMFKKLCGDNCFEHVVLATTMWEQVDPQRGSAREEELLATPDFWGYMRERRAQVKRHYRTRESALAIVEALVKTREPEVMLDIQKEMNLDRLEVLDTSAGQQVDEDLRKLRRKHEDEIRQIQVEQREALAMRDHESTKALREEKERLSELIRQSELDRETLKVDMDRLLQQKIEELQQMEQDLKMREAEVERVRTEDSAAYAAMRAENAAYKQQLERKENGLVKKVSRLIERASNWAEKNPNKVKAIKVMLTQIGMRAAMATAR